jgi:hypothetical protein
MFRGVALTLLQRLGSQEEFGTGIRQFASRKPRRPKPRLGQCIEDRALHQASGRATRPTTIAVSTTIIARGVNSIIGYG